MIILWLGVCIFFTMFLFYSTGLSVGASFLLALITWVVGLTLIFCILNTTKTTNIEYENKKLNELKTERDKIPSEYQHFNNPVYSDLSIRIAEIELKQRGITTEPYKPYKEPLKWTKDDIYALALTKINKISFKDK